LLRPKLANHEYTVEFRISSESLEASKVTQHLALEPCQTWVAGWPQREKIAKYSATSDLIWWCGHFQSSLDGGPTLSAELLRDLGGFGVELYIDNYLSQPE